MRKQLFKYIVLLLFICLNWSKVHGQMRIYNRFMPINLANDSIFTTYFMRFKRAVSKDDSSEIIRHLTFPMYVNLDKSPGKTNEIKHIKVSNSKQFLFLYPKIFNTRMKKLIAEQQLKDLTFMEQGLMMHRGQIWWHYYNDNKKIIISTISNVGYISQ